MIEIEVGTLGWIESLHKAFIQGLTFYVYRLTVHRLIEFQVWFYRVCCKVDDIGVW